MRPNSQHACNESQECHERTFGQETEGALDRTCPASRSSKHATMSPRERLARGRPVKHASWRHAPATRGRSRSGQHLPSSVHVSTFSCDRQACTSLRNAAARHLLVVVIDEIRDSSRQPVPSPCITIHQIQIHRRRRTQGHSRGSRLSGHTTPQPLSFSLPHHQPRHRDFEQASHRSPSMLC